MWADQDEVLQREQRLLQEATRVEGKTAHGFRTTRNGPSVVGECA